MTDMSPGDELTVDDLTAEERRIAEALRRPAYPEVIPLENTFAGEEAIRDDSSLTALTGTASAAPDLHNPLFLEPR